MKSSKQKEEIVAIYDIGSGSVGGALVSIPKTSKKKSFNFLTLSAEESPEDKPLVLYSTRTPITLNQDFDFDHFLFETGRALENVSKKMEQALFTPPMAGRGAPAKVFCFLSAPWYSCQTRIIKLKRNTPYKFTEKLAEEYIQKEIKNFESIQAKHFENTGEKMRLIESRIMEMKLNGYKTAMPFDKKISEFEIALFVAVGSERILGAIEHQIQHFFNQEVVFESFIFPSFAVSRDIFPDEKNFISIDIAGEVTDLSVSRDEVLDESITYPLGKNYFIREISRALGLDSFDAHSALTLYLSGHGHKAMNKKLEPILARAGMQWLSYFQNALREISGKKSIPAKIFLTADPDMSAWFGELLKMEEFHKYTLTDNKFNVTIIKPSDLYDFINFRSGLKRDEFLMIEAIFINRIKNHA